MLREELTFYDRERSREILFSSNIEDTRRMRHYHFASEFFKLSLKEWRVNDVLKVLRMECIPNGSIFFTPTVWSNCSLIVYLPRCAFAVFFHFISALYISVSYRSLQQLLNCRLCILYSHYCWVLFNLFGGRNIVIAVLNVRTRAEILLRDITGAGRGRVALILRTNATN